MKNETPFQQPPAVAPHQVPRLRIVFVEYVLDPAKPGRSGLSDVVWDMASTLVDYGHEVHVVAAYSTTHYPDARVMVHRIVAPPMGYRNIVGNVWLLARAARVVRQLAHTRGIDIVHAPDYITTAVLPIFGVTTPLVLTVPGNIYHRLREGNAYEWYFVQILKWAARTSARRCSSIIAVSRDMKAWWEWTGAPPERTPWIPYGVNSTRFAPVPQHHARATLALPPDAVIMLYAGRLSHEKGLLDLLHAVAAMRSRHTMAPDALRIIIIGSGNQHAALAHYINTHQLHHLVTLHPWVEQATLPLWYSAADAYLLPSHSEGFSRTIPEAMCCGTPVIGSAITGTVDHVHNYVNGLLFPVRDVAALARILDIAATQPRILRHMRANTLAYAHQHLTWHHIVGRIINDVYLPLQQLGSNNDTR